MTIKGVVDLDVFIIFQFKSMAVNVKRFGGAPEEHILP
jgi:hypothetical protein